MVFQICVAYKSKIPDDMRFKTFTSFLDQVKIAVDMHVAYWN